VLEKDIFLAKEYRKALFHKFLRLRIEMS